MHDVVQLMIFLAVAFGFSCAMWPVFRWLRDVDRWLTVVIALTVLFTPFVIERSSVGLRALACFLAIDWFFKLVDYGRQQRITSNGPATFAAYVRFLFPFPVLMVRFGQRSRRSQVNRSKIPVAALIVFVFSRVLVDLASHVEAVRTSFLHDHTLKFFIFVVAVESLANVLHGMEQLAGYRMPPLIRQAWRSSSVADFWCRFNTRVHAWFDENVFRPAGGHRKPIRGVVLTFFVSAVLHDMMFAIATSRVDGYQFVFFMLQAPAVILGRPLKRLFPAGVSGQLMSCALTVLWMWATSVFFFHGVNRVFPFFYAAEPWLP